jgi:hypothetical protein
MCLTNISQKLIAETNINCYKVAKYDINYYTFFRNTKIILGKTYKTKIEIVDNSINKGLHSFINLNDAIKFIYVNGGCIINAIIPIGSIYYTGDFGFYDYKSSTSILPEYKFLKSFASNKITYLDRYKHMRLIRT